MSQHVEITRVAVKKITHQR